MSKPKTIKYICLIFIFIANNFEALIAQNNNRGIYFEKKTYILEHIPSFNESKNNLPIPILTNDTAWIGMYWKAWEIAFTNFKQPPKGSPLVSNYADAAFNNYIFQWDTEFMMTFAVYAHKAFPAIKSLDNFYCSQHNDGLIWRVIKKSNGKDHWWGGGMKNARTINPPLFSWAELKYYDITGDSSRFQIILPVIEKYMEWIEMHRKCNNTIHKLYWTNGQASGMDNTPRDEGRKGGHSSYTEYGWVDLSCQMVIEYKSLAFICNKLHLQNKSNYYLQKADSIGNLINKWMWNEEDGLYYDIDEKGTQIKWKTVACFWPMLAGISDYHKNEKMIVHLKDTSEFWRKNVFPTLAANQKYYNSKGQYWLGGVWAPLNYIIIKGLQYNKNDYFAYQATEKYLNQLYNVYKNTKTLWEAYSPDVSEPATNVKGKRLVRKDFVGWTGCGPICLLIENIIGIRCNANENTICWNILRKDIHGIKNLNFAKSNISLIYYPSDGKINEYVEVITTHPFILEITSYNGFIKKYYLSKGEERIFLNR